MEVARRTEPADMSGGTNPNEHSETVQYYGSISTPNTQPPVRPLVGPGPYEVDRGSSSRGLLEAGGPSSPRNTPSPFERAPGPKVAGNTPYQGTFRTRVRSRSSLPWPSTNPTSSQASGIAATSTSTINRRRDSLGEIEAQRGNFPVPLLLPTNPRS